MKKERYNGLFDEDVAVDVRYDELSLVQRRKLEPVYDALEYTNDAEEDVFDPVHAVAVLYGKDSAPLDQLYPDISGDSEDIVQRVLRDDRSLDVEMKRWEQQRAYLQRKIDEHTELFEQFIGDHGLNGAYTDTVDQYVDMIESIQEPLSAYVNIEDEIVEKTTGASEGQIRQVVAEDLAEKIQEYEDAIDSPPTVPDAFRSAMQNALTGECRSILGMDVAVTEAPVRPQSSDSSTGTDETPRETAYVAEVQSGPEINWSRYNVEDRNEQQYLEALAAFDADKHTTALDADLLRGVIDWSVNGNTDALPYELRTNDDLVAAAKQLNRNSSSLYEGRGTGMRSSLNRTVATARHIADRHLVE